MGLRVYTVHLPPPSSDDPTPVLVKEGFSWPGFFFGVIWALWHRLWIEAAALLALFIAAGVIFDVTNLGEPVESVIMFAVALLVGLNGNDWRRESLRRRGYQEAGVVAGPDSDNALRRFLDLRAVTVQATRPIYPPTGVSGGTPGSAAPGAVKPGALAAGSIAGWYSSSVPPAGSSSLRGFDPTALRASAAQDRDAMKSLPTAESHDPPPHPERTRNSTSQLDALADRSGLPFGTGF
jgi:hypothetical protein